MSFHRDETGMYTVDGDGRKCYGDSTSMKINGKEIFQFDPVTGVLKLLVDEDAIAMMKERCGEFPIKELMLVLGFPLGETIHFHNVTAIELLLEDGVPPS